MKKINKKVRNEILKKGRILQYANSKLKEEFVGIDNIIDEVIDLISTWYLYPELQERPVIINLWGLTGTGKTALVKRLSYYLECDNKCYNFNIEELINSYRGLEQILEELHINRNESPIILAFDEFQFARTINEDGLEINNQTISLIWNLLDSGKFQYTSLNNDIFQIKSLIRKIKYFLNNGLDCNNGLLKKQKGVFISNNKINKEVRDFYEENKENLNGEVRIVPKYFHKIIMYIMNEKYLTTSALIDDLKKLDGYQTIDFLKYTIDYELRPKIIDCSKALIFVIGNLDEAYKISKNFNTDVSADEFHEISLDITVPIIKKALQKRFRNEQIARLGNSHIIYPAFNKDSFYKIIDLELDKIALKFFNKQNVKLEFDKSIKDLIYREGVYPTQGTRPIFTTIHNIINSKLGKVVIEIILNNLNVEKVKFSFKIDKIIMSYYYKNIYVHKIEVKQILNLEKLRQNKKDDLQAITAVHESGHAICCIFLMKTLPEVIYSITTNNESQGTTYMKFHWKYISRKNILNRVALLLGGFTAEKLIFGNDNLTTGSSSDIEMATTLITDMIKNSGMGNLPAQFNIKDFRTNLCIYDDDLNELAKNWIEKAIILAENILKREETLLLKMSDYLSDKRMMDKELIDEYCLKYSKNYKKEEIIKKGELLFYRKHLKEKIDNLDRKEFLNPINNQKLCLNKNDY